MHHYYYIAILFSLTNASGLSRLFSCCGRGKVKPQGLSVFEPLRTVPLRAESPMITAFRHELVDSIPPGLAIRVFFSDISRYNLYGLPLLSEDQLDSAREVLSHTVHVEPHTNQLYPPVIVAEGDIGIYFVKCYSDVGNLIGILVMIAPENQESEAARHCMQLRALWLAVADLFDSSLVPWRGYQETRQGSNAFELATFPNTHQLTQFGTLVV